MPEQSTEVITKDDVGTLPATILEELAADSGRGGEDATSEDMIVPFIKCAQAIANEVNPNDAAYIDGLVQGDFFNSATQRIWLAEKGFYFIPCYYRRMYLEWLPNRGGFAGEHGPEIMDQCTQEEDFSQTLENGNEIVPTGTWYGLVVDKETGETEQAVISLSKSQMKKSRQLMTKLRSITIPGPENKRFNPAFFYNVVHVLSVPESNDQGNWMGWTFKLDGTCLDLPNGEDLYQQGKALLAAVQTGAVKAAEPVATDNVDDEIPF